MQFSKWRGAKYYDVLVYGHVIDSLGVNLLLLIIECKYWLTYHTMTHPNLGYSLLCECVRDCDLSLMVITFVLLTMLYII